MLKKVFLFITFSIWLWMGLSSCVSEHKASEDEVIDVHYASLLKMEQADSFTCVKVIDPWNTKRVKATYVLVPKSIGLPSNLPQGIVIRTPIGRATLTSSVHMSLMFDLHTESSMTGVTDTAYVISKKVKDYIVSHKEVLNMGSSMQPDVERIKSSHTEAVFVSPFENADYGPLGHCDIPLIECADYMETSPLGRAEWMRFYGRLFDKGEYADSLFESVEKRYLSIKEKVDKIKGVRPTVMCDLRTGGTWYQPGGESTMGRFISDAGGRYLWAERKESGSIPLSVENVLMQGRNADVWLVKYGQSSDMTYAQMKNDYPPYTQFKAWKEHHIWACNTMKSAFYEEVPFHPDLLLNNLVNIFHPEASSIKNEYYQPMK